MKLFLRITLCFLLLLIGFSQTLLAQVVTAGPDSAVVSPGGNIVQQKLGGLSRPGKAALFSAVIPGLGQAYNKSFWKIPLVYGALGGVGYSIYYNHHNFLNYRQAHRLRVDGDPSTKDRFEGQFRTETLLVRRDGYRRLRDLSMLYMLLAYGLNVTEAYVHAHLKDFDVSEEISLQIRPDVIRTASNPSFSSTVPALTFSFNLKK